MPTCVERVNKENKDKMKDLSFNTASDNTYELMTAAFEETDWNMVLRDLRCEESNLKFLSRDLSQGMFWLYLTQKRMQGQEKML